MAKPDEIAAKLVFRGGIGYLPTKLLQVKMREFRQHEFEIKRPEYDRQLAEAIRRDLESG
jgi:hypothetical protein